MSLTDEDWLTELLAPPNPADPITAVFETALEVAEDRIKDESLFDFMPRVSPFLEAPLHLKPYIDVLEATRTTPQHVGLAAPPQHGKTEATIHFLVWLMMRDPRKCHAYVTYGQERAESVSVKFQRIAERAGLKLTGNRSTLYTSEGGQVKFVGLDGQLTGEPINGLLIIDDPIKNRKDAESSLLRDRVWDAFTDTAQTRCHPGSSIVAMQTRWHPEDLVGRLHKIGWRYVNLPAIGDDGTALWPKERPLAWLNERRATMGEYSWASMYMGAPRPRGGSVFKDPHYGDAPSSGFRIAVGVDFAYSKKTYADYSVAVVAAKVGDKIHILDVLREQIEAPKFCDILGPVLKKYGVPAHAYIGGTERGIVDFMARQGVRIVATSASEDKFTRAQGAAAAWNAGKLLLPAGAKWLDTFIAEVCSFTGVNDSHDDQVDAMASAVNALAIAPPRQPFRSPDLLF